MDTNKSLHGNAYLSDHQKTDNVFTRLQTGDYWKVFNRAIFIVIRSILWAQTFICCTPVPMKWLHGIVTERDADRELCVYDLTEDMENFTLYILYLFIWALPFVKIRKMWSTLRYDVISLLASIILNTSLYLCYVEWLS